MSDVKQFIERVFREDWMTDSEWVEMQSECSKLDPKWEQTAQQIKDEKAKGFTLDQLIGAARQHYLSHED